MHTQKTQVLTNGINDLNDNRRDILKHFNEKLNDEKKAKLARKQKFKGKNSEQKGQSRKGSTQVKKRSTNTCTATKRKRHRESLARRIR